MQLASARNNSVCTTTAATLFYKLLPVVYNLRKTWLVLQQKMGQAKSMLAASSPVFASMSEAEEDAVDTTTTALLQQRLMSTELFVQVEDVREKILNKHQKRGNLRFGVDIPSGGCEFLVPYKSMVQKGLYLVSAVQVNDMELAGYVQSCFKHLLWSEGLDALVRIKYSYVKIIMNVTMP